MLRSDQYNFAQSYNLLFFVIVVFNCLGNSQANLSFKKSNTHEEGIFQGLKMPYTLLSQTSLIVVIEYISIKCFNAKKQTLISSQN